MYSEERLTHDVPSDAAIPTNATGNETFITRGRGQRGTAKCYDSWSSGPPSAHFRAEMVDYFLLGSSDVNVGFDYADALSFLLENEGQTGGWFWDQRARRRTDGFDLL